MGLQILVKFIKMNGFNNGMVTSKQLAIGAGALAGIGGLIGYAVYRKRKSTKKSNKRKSSSKSRTKNSRSRSNYRKGKQKQPYTAGKRKDTSHRRIRYTKNNQPYIILKSGKSRFISKKSVRMSRKRSGGKY